MYGVRVTMLVNGENGPVIKIEGFLVLEAEKIRAMPNTSRVLKSIIKDKVETHEFPHGIDSSIHPREFLENLHHQYKTPYLNVSPAKDWPELDRLMR